MSTRIGKITFSCGAEAFLVYTDSPGWAYRQLFPSINEASDWITQDLPEMIGQSALALEVARASEEPARILVDISMPDHPALWFYTTASKAGMVITGPVSREESEFLYERGEVIYSKEFFDSWLKDSRPSTDHSLRSGREKDSSDPEP